MAAITKSKMAKKREEEPKKKKSQTREYTEAILVALIAALILRTFVIQAFRIPTGSMKDTLLVGDFLLVNKFIYGARTPDTIPFTEIALPYVRFPAFADPKPGEIVVFKYPENMTQDYIKRCIAGPGQTLEVRQGDVYIDGQPEGAKEYLGKQYDPEEGHYVDSYRITRSNGKSYTVRYYAERNRASDRYGPIHMPKKGETIELTPATATQYRNIITTYEQRDLRIEGDSVYLDGRPASQYTFAQDYYFMMGDNRDNSLDSRAWGMLPRENVVGEALVIYWSWNHYIPLYKFFEKVRWSRIGNIIR